MAYDDAPAERVRDRLRDAVRFTEKRCSVAWRSPK
jgi:hypothetical protein